MADDKEIRWADGHDAEDEDRGDEARAEDESTRASTEPWDAYRKWLSHRSDKGRSRSTLDPSLYTWKGYRNWAEEVKRNWSDRHGSDNDDS